MVKIVITSAAGQTSTLEAKAGSTLMEAARDNNILGIVAECGGACSCATCHVHVGYDWLDKLPAKSSTEVDMLDFADNLDERRSRLSCQIVLKEELDGMSVTVPT
ncbi:2Fe-2S iron-sulfur cluster-binding protein [Rhizobiaceae sp. 2RAB30]